MVQSCLHIPDSTIASSKRKDGTYPVLKSSVMQRHDYYAFMKFYDGILVHKLARVCEEAVGCGIATIRGFIRRGEARSFETGNSPPPQ